MVGFTYNPYFLQCSLRVFTSSSRSDWIRSARTWVWQFRKLGSLIYSSLHQLSKVRLYLNALISTAIFLHLENCLIQLHFPLLKVNHITCIMRTTREYNEIYIKMKKTETRTTIACQKMRKLGNTWTSRNVASSIVNFEATSPDCLYFSSYFLARVSTWNMHFVHQDDDDDQGRLRWKVKTYMTKKDTSRLSAATLSVISLNLLSHLLLYKTFTRKKTIQKE